MRHRLVLLDLDGTLLDHFAAIHRCHAYAMRQIGLTEPTLAQVRSAVGGGLEHAISRLAGEANVTRILPHYLAHWNQTMLDDVVLLPGATELLAAIRDAGGRAAVLTNKRGDFSRQVCAHLGITPLLAGITGAGDTPWFKPARELTLQVLSQLDTDPRDACYVGDSPFDVLTALNAGLEFYGVTTGTHSDAELGAAGGTRVYPGLPAVQTALGLA